VHTIRTLFLLALVCSLAPSATSAQGFEGTFQQRMRMLTSADLPQLRADGPGAASPDALLALPVEEVLATPSSTFPQMRMTAHIKGRRMRMSMEIADMPMAGMAEMYTIMDLERDQMTIVIPPMRRAMRTSVSEMTRGQEQAAVQFQPQGMDPLAEPRVRELGDSTLHGMPVRIHDVTVGDMAMRIWATPMHADLAAAMEGMQVGMQGGASLPGGRQLNPAALGLENLGLPVRTQMVMPVPEEMRGMAGAGFLYLVVDLFGIEPRPVPDEMFTVPADYQVVPVPAGMMMQSQP
jgi:hypothetical protein